MAPLICIKLYQQAFIRPSPDCCFPLLDMTSPAYSMPTLASFSGNSSTVVLPITTTTLPLISSARSAATCCALIDDQIAEGWLEAESTQSQLSPAVGGLLPERGGTGPPVTSAPPSVFESSSSSLDQSSKAALCGEEGPADEVNEDGGPLQISELLSEFPGDKHAT